MELMVCYLIVLHFHFDVFHYFHDSNDAVHSTNQTLYKLSIISTLCTEIYLYIFKKSPEN